MPKTIYNHCLNCNNLTLNPKFCNHSCAAKKTNTLRKRNSQCRHCKENISFGKVYCNLKCQGQWRTEQSFKNQEQTNNYKKSYILNELGSVCQQCGISEWNDKPITIELEHIDGNSENNTRENLTLLCPNCHSQTDTYKSKNRGNGRHSRKMRYQQGKSF